MRYRCARVQGPTAVGQQVSDVPLSRGERRLIWKTLHDNSSSVANAALDENQADGTASSVNLQSARQPTLEGRSRSDSADEDDDPVRRAASKVLDPLRLATGFGYVLRDAYAMGSDWGDQNRLRLLRDIGSIVAASCDGTQPRQ